MQINQNMQPSKRLYRTVLILATVCLSACGFVPELRAADEPGRIRDPKTGFSFVPPPGWVRAADLPHPALSFMYIGPTLAGFRANVNLASDKDTGEKFEDVIAQVKQVYPKMFPSWRAGEEGPSEVNGKPIYFLSGSYRGGPHSVRLAQFFIRGNGKLLTLTFTTADSAFDQLSPAIAQSAMSVRVE
jgi:hypothetical protein